LIDTILQAHYREKLAVTTSLRPTREQVITATELARKFNVPFKDRDGLSLKTLASNLNIPGLLVVSSLKISYVSGQQEFFFHPGLARLRIKGLKYGKTDQMIRAMSLKEGETLLDCTMGLGSDAVVASYVSGGTGKVVGLESSTVIAVLVEHGLQTYCDPENDIAMSMRRVKVFNIDHINYLSGLDAGSYDIVYFDPMFRYPRHKSPSINAMRNLANPEPVKRETIEKALRVARKRVVMKERRNSPEFKRLGFNEFVGGKYGPVAYGVIER